MSTALLAEINESVGTIDILINEKISRSKTSSIKCGSWKLDDELKATINNVKTCSESLSKTCIKLVLLSSKKPSMEIMNSILYELHTQCNGFKMIYLSFLSYSVSDCLFDYVSKAVRVLLVHIKDLVLAISADNLDSINMHAGMISRISDDNQKLPLANRLAYRRFIMERCAIVKETLTEFEQYIADYKAKLEASGSVDEAVSGAMEGLTISDGAAVAAEKEGDAEDSEGDDEEFDEDEENQEYSAVEVLVVERCLAVIRAGFDSLKATLSAVTAVSDSITSAQAAAKDAAETALLAELEGHCQVWVASLTRQASTVQDLVIDVGSDLYPPFDPSDESIATQLGALKQQIGVSLDLLSRDLFRQHLSSELLASIESIKTAVISN